MYSDFYQAKPSWSPGMEMTFESIRPTLLYRGKKYIPLPRGEKPGYGNALIMLTPSQEDTVKEIQTDYLRWFLAQYKWYTTDSYFKEKIGKTHVYVNMTQVLKRDWNTTKFPHPLRYATKQMRANITRQKLNLIVDMGEWTKFYFEYSFKVSIPVIIKNYIQFLASKINVSDYQGYEKILYIPLNQWFSERKENLGFSRKQLNNPLAILLFAAYKFPETLALLPANMRVILGDSTTDEFMMLSITDFTKKNFPKIKNKLKVLSSFKWDEESEQTLDANFTEEENDPESDLNNAPDPLKYPDQKKVVPEVPADASDEEKAKQKLKEENRARLINDMKRNLMGPSNPSQPAQKHEISEKGASPSPEIAGTKINDLTKKVGKKVASTATNTVSDLTKSPEIYDEEDLDLTEDDTIPISMEDPDLDEAVQDGVDDALTELQKDDPNALLNEDGQLSSNVVAGSVKKRLKATYMPKHTEAQIARMKELKSKQDKILNTIPKAEMVKSKIIEHSDFSKAVKTTNTAITHSKYVNFDKDYNEKKLKQDIDGAVGALAEAEIPVFVTNKVEEDTSSQLALKKTVTYELEDEWGGKHKITLDLPVIVDNNYIWFNGSKQLLGHQQIMMPIVKSGPADVQIVTWYNKLILHRRGVNDTRTEAIKTFMSTNNAIFKIEPGNAMAKNQSEKYHSTLDIDMYAKQFMKFHIGHSVFILDRAALNEKLKSMGIKFEDTKEQIPVGYNSDTKAVYYVTPQVSMTDLIMSRLSEKDKGKIASKTKSRARRQLLTEISIMERKIPLVLLLCFYEGFEEVMKKAEINYHVVDKDDTLEDFNRSKYDIIACMDKYIVWERDPIWNTMLMNGFAAGYLEGYTWEEIQDPETFGNILTNFTATPNTLFAFRQYYDFMIDPATKEILEDYELPTDLVSLCILGNKMLADNAYTPINNANAFRIRSNEIIAEAVYKVVTDAYGKFRSTQSKMGRNRKPDRINVKQSAVMDEIIRKSSLTSEASILNPILEIEKARTVTPRGPRGVGKPRAMTQEKRAYDPTMLGILAMTSSNDAKVGVNRQLTLEPNITSTRGYVQVTDPDEINELSSAQLMSPAEMLSPPGALHDDGPRTAMAFKQTQYMLPVEGSCPVFFGNKVEEVMPYHISREFVVTAKQDGQVVEIKDGIVVVQYKDGSYDSIDTNPRMKKNSSSGFYIRTRLNSNLTEVGQKFKKNEVLAQDSGAFTKNTNDLSASMNIGVPIKVAIVPNYDIYEDAGPITKKLSEKFTTHMSMKTEAGIPAQSYVEKMVNIGDEVKVDDPLIIYDPAHEDAETNAFLNEIRDKLGEDLEELVDLQSMPQVRTEYAGTVVDIEVFSSVPMEELSPSLQEIVKKYTKHSANVVKLLTKYQNPGDMNYYKCGQIISNAPEVVQPDYQNRVKGVQIGADGRGVAIIFYVEFKDIAKTGDKGSAFTALKFTTSHVIPEGKEPYSEYRPNEEISTFIAPSAIIARKTPSILVTMFANKCIIEMKRHALDIFFNDDIPLKERDPNDKTPDLDIMLNKSKSDKKKPAI